MNVTDFSNNDALIALLSNLENIFTEFKSHEEIENEHIMKKLKSKLRVKFHLCKYSNYFVINFVVLSQWKFTILLYVIATKKMSLVL